MAVAYRDSTSATKLTGGGTLTINVPALVQNGDVMIAAVETTGPTTLPGTPSGWTALDGFNSAGPTVRSYYRVASSEPASYGFTVADDSVGIIIAYSGADTTTPINQHGAWNRTALSTTITATSITTTQNGCMLVFLGISSIAESYTGPSGFTDRVTASGVGWILAAELLQATAGATGAVTATLGVAHNNHGSLVALNPAAAAAAFLPRVMVF